MRWIFLLLIGLLISVGLGWLFPSDNGYVLIQYLSWSVELSFTLLMSLILALILLIVLLTVFFSRIGLRRWRRRTLRSERGWGLLLMGDFRRARKVFARSRWQHPGGLLSALGEVFASHGLEQWTQRDADFSRLSQYTTLPSFAAGMLQARLLLDEGAPERALAVVESFLPEYRKKPGLYRVRFRCLKALGRWSEIACDLADYRRRGAIPEAEWPAVRHQCARAVLTDATQQGAEAVEKAFRGLSASLRSDPQLFGVYVRGLMVNGQMIDAEKRLARELSSNWNDELLSLYGEVRLASYDRMFERCEIWLKSHPEDHQLQFIAGKLAFLCQLWGRARGCLEASLQAVPRVETCIMLGQLMEKLDEPYHASDYYRQATQLFLHQQRVGAFPARGDLVARVSGMLESTTPSPTAAHPG